MNIDLKHLDTLFGEEKIRTGRAKLILIGKASAVIGKLDLGDEKPYHIDVMLDLRATDKRRDCMTRPEISRVFREFKMPPKDDSTGPWESFFRQSRADVFANAVPKGTPVFAGIHLQVYLLDRQSALELELRRWEDPKSDEGTRKASLAIAVGLLWRSTEQQKSDRDGKKPYIRPWKDVDVSDASINKVEGIFLQRHRSKLSNAAVLD